MSSVIIFFKFYFRQSFALTFFLLLFFKGKEFIPQKLPPRKQRSLHCLPTGTREVTSSELKKDKSLAKKRLSRGIKYKLILTALLIT